MEGDDHSGSSGVIVRGRLHLGPDAGVGRRNAVWSSSPRRVARDLCRVRRRRAVLQSVVRPRRSVFANRTVSPRGPVCGRLALCRRNPRHHQTVSLCSAGLRRAPPREPRAGARQPADRPQRGHRFQENPVSHTIFERGVRDGHVNRNESSTGTETAARAEQRLLSARRDIAARRTRGGETGACIHGEQCRADHHQVLGRGRIPVRIASGVQGAEPRRRRHAGLWVPRRKRIAFRPRGDGDVTCRLLDRDLLRRPQRPGDGFDLSRRIGRAEAEVAAGLLTTAKRDGDTWVLNGQKRWIGNAPWCDVSVIWARDLADNQVKGFIVENKTTPGFSVEKIQNKIALKVVQNGHITLKDVRLPEANRLQGGNSFRDTAKVLKMTRYAVAWMATGCAMGAYETALKYAQERLQFGKPIGSFQLVQDLLAKMISNITASQCLITRQ